MTQPQPPPNNEQLFSGAKKLIDVSQLVVVIGSALAAVYGFYKTNPLLLWISITICLISIISYLVLRWFRKQRRIPIDLPAVEPTTGAFLRGLLPFERGDSLLGRDNDIRQIVTKVSSSDFKFSYISGEAGSGKTSLIRAALIPELEERGWLIIYTPKPGIDAKVAITTAIQQKLKLSETVINDSPGVLDLLLIVREQHSDKKILIVCDQFEEFFVANRTIDSRQPFIREIGSCLNDNNSLSVCFLISLRKEFVDDLQDFKDDVPQPLDARFCHRLRNWETNEALKILQAAAQYDKVPFAPALIENIIGDLEQAGEVRPVELQLVATRMHNQRIYELSQYKDAERAQGIIASYIKEIIEPLGQQTSELERQVARHLLRSLCAENADAKRPVGLSFEELLQKIKATISTKGEYLVQDFEQYQNALQQVINRCLSAYLIIREDEQHFNLIHDYIVRPILDATSDIETVEEQANRLLDQYIDEEKRKSNATIAWRHYSFINKYASPQRKAEERVARLFKRTKRIFVYRGLAVLAALLILTTVIVPPRSGFKVEEPIHLPDSSWVISQDKRYAVSLNPKGKSFLWNINQDWSQKVEIPIQFEKIIISPHSKFLAGITKDGKIYIWRTEENINAEAKPALTVEAAQPEEDFSYHFWSAWGEFSPNDEWFYAFSKDANFYLWKAGENLGENPQPTLKLNVLEPFSRLPIVAFSPTSKYLSVINADRGVRFIRLSPFSADSQNIDIKVMKNFGEGEKIYFSNNDEWIAFTGEDNKVYLSRSNGFPNLAFESKILNADKLARNRAFDIYFSHNDEYIVAKEDLGNFYVWRVNDPINTQPYKVPNIEISEGCSPCNAPIDFSLNNELIAGSTENSALYLWQLNKSPAATVEPVIPEDRLTASIKFSPNSSWIAAVISNGGVYAWKIETKPDLSKPIAIHADGESVFLNWSSDNKHLFTYGGNDVFISRADEQIYQYRGYSEVQNIAETTDRKKLIVFSEQYLTIIKYDFYFWGIPVYSFDFPELFQ